MKVLHIIVGSLFLTLLAACVSPQQPSAQERLNADHNSQSITLSLGQTLTISLPGNPGTGFQWEITRMPPFLAQEGTPEFRPDDSSGQRVGAGGLTVWHMKANAPGSGALDFAYRRAWEKEVPPAKTIHYEIRVRPSSEPE